MSDEPKGKNLPVVLGVLMVGCCLGPVFIGLAGAGLAGWFSDLTIGETAALAFLSAFFVYGVIRFRRMNAAPDGALADPIIENPDRGTQ